jgi:hypothetical protein
MDLKNLAKIDLIEELGLENLSKEQQEKILLDMGEIIQQRVMLRIIEELGNENKDEFVKLLEEKKDQPEEIENFIRAKVPEADDIMMEEIGAYKKEITELVDKLKKTEYQDDKEAGEISEEATA